MNKISKNEIGNASMPMSNYIIPRGTSANTGPGSYHQEKIHGQRKVSGTVFSKVERFNSPIIERKIKKEDESKYRSRVSSNEKKVKTGQFGIRGGGHTTSGNEILYFDDNQSKKEPFENPVNSSNFSPSVVSFNMNVSDKVRPKSKSIKIKTPARFARKKVAENTPREYFRNNETKKSFCSDLTFLNTDF